MKTIALIPAGGKGRRMQSPTPKQFLSLAGQPVLAHTLAVFEQCPAIDGVYVIVPPDEMTAVQQEIIEVFPFRKVLKVVGGGRQRQQSVWNGLRAIPGDCALVVVHDGVRPLLSPALIEAVIEETRLTGAAIAALPARETVKRRLPDRRLQTLPREDIWLAQTPQGFAFDLLYRAHQKAAQDKFFGTDDASLVERLDRAVSLVPGSLLNLKITTPEDLLLAETLMAAGKGKI